MGDVVWGLAELDAMLDGVAWVISGAWLGFLSGLSSILSSSLGSASVCFDVPSSGVNPATVVVTGQRAVA